MPGTELIHLLSGEVSYHHGGHSYRMRPGDTLMFDPAALHGPEQLFVFPCTYLSIIVYGA